MSAIRLKTLINQKGYERIIKSVRRDKIILLGSMFFYFLLFLAPVILYLLFKNNFFINLTGSFWRVAAIMGASIYYFSCWLFFFGAFLDYYLDFWVITNDRLLNIEQNGTFARIISELDLYKIQDATSEVKGILASLFGYGSIHIQTAGETKRFELKQIPNPHELRKIIMDMAEEDRKFHMTQTK
ncbi:MAG: PH domain-containing protein [Patescibacteria group bacterium]